MALPSIFGKLKQWMAGQPAKALLGVSGASPAAELKLAMPGQAQTNWCWAAVAHGISTFYGGSTPSQCALVGQVLKIQPGTDCCSNGGTSRCNRQWYLHKALETVQCLRDVVQRADGLIPLDDVKNELAADQPLGIRVEWTRGEAQGGGHFVAISGWQTGASGAPYVTVQDPWGPATEVLPVEEFANAYGTDLGKWTHSYFTVPPHLAAQLGGSAGSVPLTADLMGG